MTDRLLKIAEVAERLRVSRETVRRLLVTGELPGLRVGQQWRIPEIALTAYLARQLAGAQSPPDPDRPEEWPRPPTHMDPGTAHGPGLEDPIERDPRRD